MPEIRRKKQDQSVVSTDGSVRDGAADSSNGNVAAPTSGNGNAAAAVTHGRVYRPSLSITPPYLQPAMTVQVSEPAIYRSLFIVDTVSESASTNSGLKELDGPIDPFAADLSEAQTKPAVGVLTVHSQGWVQKGLAIGNLLNSVCLAPGEVTRVAVTDWRRTSRGSKQAAIEQGESVTSQIEQARAVNEVQHAVANEAQWGNSSMVAGSTSAQAGIAMSSLFASISASASTTASSALTAQFSAGSKNLAASSTNAINQRTAEKSQSLRSRRQSVVQEVSEQESETLSSRILANYNRRHSLNIEYFEVLQIYEIETELVGWERCLFVPLVPLNFMKAGADGKSFVADLEVIKRHRAQLISIYRDLGVQQMVDRLLHLEDDQRELDAAAKAAGAKIPLLQGAAALAGQFVAFAGMNLDPNSADGSARFAIAIRENLRSEYRKLTEALGGGLPRIEQPDAINSIVQLMKEQENRLTSLKLDLGDALNADRMFLSQQIWLRMTPYKIYRILQGYKISGQPISMLVAPYPVGVFGNYLAFRWGFPRSDPGQKARDEFESKYLKQDDSTATPPTTVALPTSGVFAEAVLGQGVAAEVKDEYHFGRWGEDVIPILPPEIKAIRSRDRSHDMDLSTADFADPMARLRAKELADISHIKDIMDHYGEFRDMSGKEEAAMLVSQLAKISGKGATAAGNRAVELHSKMLDTFVEVLNSDVFKAVAAEALAPGVGPAMLQASAGSGSKKKAAEGETGEADDADSDDGDEENDTNSANSSNAVTANATASNATGSNAAGSSARASNARV